MTDTNMKDLKDDVTDLNKGITELIDKVTQFRDGIQALIDKNAILTNKRKEYFKNIVEKWVKRFWERVDLYSSDNERSIDIVNQQLVEIKNNFQSLRDLLAKLAIEDTVFVTNCINRLDRVIAIKEQIKVEQEKIKICDEFDTELDIKVEENEKEADDLKKLADEMKCDFERFKKEFDKKAKQELILKTINNVLLAADIVLKAGSIALQLGSLGLKGCQLLKDALPKLKELIDGLWKVKDVAQQNGNVNNLLREPVTSSSLVGSINLSTLTTFQSLLQALNMQISGGTDRGQLILNEAQILLAFEKYAHELYAKAKEKYEEAQKLNLEKKKYIRAKQEALIRIAELEIEEGRIFTGLSTNAVYAFDLTEVNLALLTEEEKSFFDFVEAFADRADSSEDTLMQAEDNETLVEIDELLAEYHEDVQQTEIIKLSTADFKIEQELPENLIRIRSFILNEPTDSEVEFINKSSNSNRSSQTTLLTYQHELQTLRAERDVNSSFYNSIHTLFQQSTGSHRRVSQESSISSSISPSI